MFVLLPWLLLIGGGVAMCLLYAPGERIDTVGHVLLAVMLLPWLTVQVWGLVSCWRWESYLDVDCPSCGRPFFARDLPRLRQTGCCIHCGRPVPDEVLEAE